ncbi:MAG TPA: O-antigen ligase family protein [Bacteroidota bacterium]|mgnify:CR=1 FL=1|nr:O-antigen ligase family protein [Bacteroidota bacterium]
MISSRFDQKYIMVFLSIFAISFLLSIALMQFIAATLFILWIFEKNSEKRKSFDQITAFIFLFGLVRLITIFLSEYPQTSYEAIYKEALFYTSAVAVPFYLKNLDKQNLLKLVLVFILGAAVVSVIGSIRFFVGSVERAQTFSSGYTAFSGYLLSSLAAALFYPKKINSMKGILFWSIVYAVIFIGLITSLGRANIAIAVFVFAVALLFKQIPLKQIIVLGVIGLITFGIYLVHPSELIENRVGNITYLSERDIIWQGAKEISLQHPLLGFGPRTFRQIFPFKEEFVDKKIGSWHNDFLQIYFESGILGLIAYLSLLWIIIKTSVSHFRNNNIDPELKSLSRAALISIIALLLSSLTSGFMTTAVLSMVFIFLVSLISRIDFEVSNFSH